MTTMTTVRGEPATVKQIDFLKDLIETKQMTDAERALYTKELPAITKKTASIAISALIRAPKRVVVPELAFGVPVKNELALALSSVPKSKYAIASDEIDPMFFDGRLTNDLIFFEVREYENRLYMKKLTGSVGDFTRTRMTPRDQLIILNIIKENPEKYARAFGEHFSCCGCCGAVLTDQVSREIQFGPTCRQYFGYDSHGQKIKV